jgi:hypothetical protein
VNNCIWFEVSEYVENASLVREVYRPICDVRVAIFSGMFSV